MNKYNLKYDFKLNKKMFLIAQLNNLISPEDVLIFLVNKYFKKEKQIKHVIENDRI